ncbi:EAL domain-containing protein [Chitinivorax sp. B]|uniref:EAL domain-containing protein n=1 Tax=Chitinivorax sp. B TaxID=2502235 RepID=UPI00148593A0|nr:EAL domain-containing protein [Chitinivorax sp. B]
MQAHQLAHHIEQIYSQHFLQFPPFRMEHGQVVGRFFKYRLMSVFHPVVSLTDHEVIGWRAVLRCVSQDEQLVEPLRLFALAFDNSGLVNLDRLVRTLHVLNALHQGLDGGLFLDVHPRLLGVVKDEHGRFFERVLQQFGLTPERIVIHLPSGTPGDAVLLAKAIANYRQRGYRVATSADLSALERLAHFDEASRPELATLTLADSVPLELVDWRRQASAAGVATVAWHVELPAQRDAIERAEFDYATGHTLVD